MTMQFATAPLKKASGQQLRAVKVEWDKHLGFQTIIHFSRDGYISDNEKVWGAKDLGQALTRFRKVVLEDYKTE